MTDRDRTDLDRLVERAEHSTLFTAPRMEADLARFLARHAETIARLAVEAADSGGPVYWVGSGNSWCNLWSGKYLLDRFSRVVSECSTSYELVWRAPARLDQHATVVLASFSGATEDTVEALRFANQRGARTIALTAKQDSPLASEASQAIVYDSSALYILPMAMAYLFALEIAKLQGAQVDSLLRAVHGLPAVLGGLYKTERRRALALAEDHRHADLFYVLASGPLYGLGYKFALTVFMENMRVHGSFIETSEFRHGPVEMLDRHRPRIVLLKGTDASREMSERVEALLNEHGAEAIVFDHADHGEVDALLAPFYLMVPLQWFAVYSSLLRGISDLDERAVMGRGRLSRGAGITWP